MKNNKNIYQVFISGEPVGVYSLSQEQVRVFDFLSEYYEVCIKQVCPGEVKEI